jgi:hypothetical protein
LPLLGYRRSPAASARHSLGSTDNLDARLPEHAAGRGARLKEVVTEAGIEWSCVRTWEGSRTEERQLKRRKNAPRLCPVCSARRAER